MRIVIAVVCVIAVASCTSTHSPSTGTPAQEEGRSLVNPINPTPESVASGRKLYERLCADCHGTKGDGSSEIAAAMAADEVRPSDLTDDKWDHGSTDGDLFVNIRDGVGGPAAMKGLNGRPGVGPNEMWNVVNYVRSLKTPH